MREALPSKIYGDRRLGFHQAKTYSRSTRRGQCMDTEIKNFRRRFERKFGKAVGLGSSGLQKVSSSLQEVGNLPTRVYISSKCCFGLG